MAQTFNQQQQVQHQTQAPEYTLPGVLHFLQVEWRRYERDRNEWEIERAEMKARIALLEGERRGIERMKTDLMRRIKMLEYALVKERGKYVSNTNNSQSKETFTTDTPANEEGPDSPITLNNNNAIPQKSSPSIEPLTTETSKYKNLALSRDPKNQINYLTNVAKDNGSMINKILNRPTSLDGNNNNNNSSRKLNNRSGTVLLGINTDSYNDYNSGNNNNINIDHTMSTKKPNNVVIRPSRPAPTIPQVTSPILPTSSSKDAFFTQSNMNDLSSKNWSESTASNDENRIPFSPGLYQRTNLASKEISDDNNESGSYSPKAEEFQKDDDNGKSFVDPKSDDNWKTLNDLKNKNKAVKNKEMKPEEEEQLTKDLQEKFKLSDGDLSRVWKNTMKQSNNISDPQLDGLKFSVEDDENLPKPELDGFQSNGTDRKMWRPRFTLRGHLDTIRSLSWHKSELMFISGSDDGTLKLWDLKGPAINKPVPNHDIDPLHTYRGHTAPVNSVVMSSEQHKCYSASMDSTIRVWKLPESKIVPYGPVDPSLNLTTYIGHTDAIWDIRLFPIRQATQYLASASADGTVKIWDTEIVGSPLKCSWNYYGHNNGEMVNGDGRPPVPTSIDFVNTDLKKVVVAFQNSIIKLFDIETGQCVTTFKSNETSDNTPATQINRIISHPTLPLVFSAHEDKYIRFFDVNTGKCSFSMSAHLDSVTSLGVDPSGMVLISGGHDCSIRLWDIFSSRQCIQEFSSHRKKSDEGVLCVHYHPSLPWIASGGADSTAKRQ
ncbi:13009_t:CDS:10 [Entrophospora sp. SA101]|nr:13009_t:CDS:10 [Entrophospora sp. SA101]